MNDRRIEIRRVLAVTPGILLRILHDDPYLESTGVVIFDEFHERGLEADLALGLIRLIQTNVRPDLRIVVMSATLEAATIVAYLNSCPVIVCDGQMHKVDICHSPNSCTPAEVASVVASVLQRSCSDVLAFLPGVGEIRQTAEELQPLAGDDVLILPLHGELPSEEQDRALTPQSKRKVVLATNVAETSVTVEGISAVVDTGLARQLIYDPSVGLDRLELVPISRASADQRSGRAGRTQPGICVRLWSEVSHRSRPAQTEPEIRRVDLAGAALQILAMGEHINTFPWLDPPRDHVARQALALLEKLGAIADGRLTKTGHALARLPVHPRLARMLIEGAKFGETQRVALAAALLSERDPFPRGPATHTTTSDLLDRIEALEGTPSPLGPINRNAARFILRAREQLRALLKSRSETVRPQAFRRKKLSVEHCSPVFPIVSVAAASRAALAASWSAAAASNSRRRAA